MTLATVKGLVRPVKNSVQREMSKFMWQRTSFGRSTMEAFASLKGSMKGRDCILMCNGPSLNKVPLEKLEGKYVIGMNKINLLFERTNFRPNMIVAINKHVIEQNAAFYNETRIPLMISRVGIPEVVKRDNVHFLNSFHALDFSFTPGLMVYEGWTVTYVAMQIALYMGFARVGIVGADHNFAQVGKPNELQVSNAPDLNHFDPRYFGAGTPWQLADLEGSELAYSLARNVYEDNGVKLYNCTEGGRLEIFERMELDSFLRSSN